MSSRLAAVVALGGIVVAAAACAGGSSDPAADRNQSALAAAVRNELDGVLAGDSAPPGALALLRARGETVRAAAGLAASDTSRPMRPSVRFRVGSVTKTFVAALVLRLVAEGKLGLDDTVERWLPRALPYGDEIRVRMLMNHTSGVFDFTQDPLIGELAQREIAEIQSGHELTTPALPPRRVVELAASHPPDFPPGSAWRYSNTNSILLGLIAEEATGERLGDALRRYVFAPLGLEQTAFVPGVGIPGNHATGYLLSDGGGEMWQADNAPPGGWAASAIVSSAPDLERFFSSLLGGNLLPPRLQRELTAAARVPGPPGSEPGLGVFRFALRCGTAWGHSGAEPGFVTHVLASRNGRRIVVLAANGQNRATARNTENAARALYCRASRAEP